MCKALELKPDALRMLKAYCAERKVAFLCAAFDFDSVDLLADELKVGSMKVPSSEVTNTPLLEYIGSKEVSVLLSTGCSTLTEVGGAIEALVRGGAPDVALMHCVTNYPAPAEEANLLAMKSMADAFRLPVGYSDHTSGVEVAVAAAALGAAMIEKHFTLDRNAEGPDHRASLEPGELAAMVRGVAMASAARGDGIKRPAATELGNRTLIRKSLVVTRNLASGTRLTREMIEIKRPATGIEPSDLAKVIGRTLARTLEEDQPLTWEDLA
jgi:sialic acid synthase SpsE